MSPAQDLVVRFLVTFGRAAARLAAVGALALLGLAAPPEVAAVGVPLPDAEAAICLSMSS